ncbi:MAG: hypothetical protein KIT72_11695 [Polyangiaceae bacterium]|nr:hypothetical protein [Polyangiaceae bacterium]MCW5791076.1 hypothetical protein [Polyangiaceae bacterium]
MRALLLGGSLVSSGLIVAACGDAPEEAPSEEEGCPSGMRLITLRAVPTRNSGCVETEERESIEMCVGSELRDAAVFQCFRRSSDDEQFG